MERTADTLENCVTVLEEKSCEKQTARSDAELCTLYSALKYRIEVDEYGNRRYYNAAGFLHCEDGPAIVRVDGTLAWWQNGVLHRKDGPAIDYASGKKEWWHQGFRHRTCGPAVIRSDGSNEWWLNGIYYTKHEYIKAGGTL